MIDIIINAAITTAPWVHRQAITIKKTEHHFFKIQRFATQKTSQNFGLN